MARSPDPILSMRYSNWATRLHHLTSTSEACTFDWGHYNCALFAARWIREATGLDLAAPYVGVATDEASANAIFLKNGDTPTALGDFAAAIAAENGLAEVLPVTFAQRGDVVWLDNGTEKHPSPYGALGVVSLDGRYAVCLGEHGLKRVHMQRWRRAWRV